MHASEELIRVLLKSEPESTWVEFKHDNGSVRARFNLPDTSAGQISRLIKSCVEAGMIKPFDPDKGQRYMTYIPSWA